MLIYVYILFVLCPELRHPNGHAAWLVMCTCACAPCISLPVSTQLPELDANVCLNVQNSMERVCPISICLYIHIYTGIRTVLFAFLRSCNECFEKCLSMVKTCVSLGDKRISTACHDHAMLCTNVASEAFHGCLGVPKSMQLLLYSTLATVAVVDPKSSDQGDYQSYQHAPVSHCADAILGRLTWWSMSW